MIGLLNAYHFEKNAEPYQLEYGPMFLQFLNAALPGQSVRSYSVALGEFPKTVTECEGWIITGSPKSVYDKDPWISTLGNFVQDIDREKRKLIGVCFGHQMVAHVLGGRTEKSKKGWGVGVRNFEILNSKPWMSPKLRECSLIFSHQDQVVELPKAAELLARDTNEDHLCPHQMYSIGNHIFCFQGHPEFTPEFARGRLDARVKLIERETYNRAIESLQLKTNATEVGLWMQAFYRMI